MLYFSEWNTPNQETYHYLLLEEGPVLNRSAQWQTWQLKPHFYWKQWPSTCDFDLPWLLSMYAQQYLFMGPKCRKISFLWFLTHHEESHAITVTDKLILEIVILSPRSGEKQFSKVILQKALVLLFFSVHKGSLKHFFSHSLLAHSPLVVCFGLVNRYTLFIITFHLRAVSKVRDSKAERTQTKTQYWGGEMTFRQVNYK